MEIIEELARRRTVEGMVANIAHCNLDDDLRDLCQMVYVILLEYDSEKVVGMYEGGQLSFFIAKVITNQCRTKNSPWYNAFKKRQKQGQPLDELADYGEDA